MTKKPRRTFEKLLSALAVLLVLPRPVWSSQDIYREFLGSAGIISVSGEQIDEHHARIDSVQIAHDQYHELRILNPNTGATEILEFSDPKLQVTYTLPYHGKFLKLKIKRREKDGLRTADFVLASDETHYIPVRQNLRKYRVFQQDIDLGGVAVCRMPQQSLINKAGIDPVIDALLDTPHNVATRCLDSSCQKDPFLAEYQSIVAGVSQVIASRDSTNSKSGKFLACLNDHKLLEVAGHLKTYFSDSLKPAGKPSVVCENKSNGTRGEFTESENADASITNLNLPWAYASKKNLEPSAEAYYADTFFHESLHRAGIEDEKLTANIVSCCGMESPTGDAKACGKVDESILKTNERNARLTASVQMLDGFKDFWLKVEKSADEERAGVIYDDFFELLNSQRGKAANTFGKCLSSHKENTESCTQNFTTELNDTIDKYFSSSCPKKFGDQKRQKALEICNDLAADGKSILQRNLTKVCDPSKANSLERSCLLAVEAKKNELLANAGDQGQLLDSPKELETSTGLTEQDKLTDSFLTAFIHQIPELAPLYSKMKDKINVGDRDERAQTILYQMIKYLSENTKTLREEYNGCLAKGESKESCAEKSKDKFYNQSHSLSHFFRRVCPAYFTHSELEDGKHNACKKLNDKVTEVFENSFRRGCKTQDTSKQIGVPGNDLTCLFNAIDEGSTIYANYDQAKKAGDVTNARSKALSSPAQKEAKDVAGKSSEDDGKKPPSISIGDQTSSRSDGSSLARSTTPSSGTPSHGGHRSAHRSPASSSGPVYSYDPGAGFEDQLKGELSQQPAPARKVLQDAGRVLADMAVPRAQAETRSEADTSALAVQAPAALSNRATIAGDLEVVTALNAGMTNSSASAQRDSGSAKTASSAAKGQSQGQAASAANKVASDDRTGSDREAGRSPSSTEAASKAGRESSSKKSQGTTASSSGKTGPSGSEKVTSQAEVLNHLQHQLLKHFRDQPKDALERLKSGSLSSELASDLIEAKDDEGRAYGSKSPKVKIWYDKTAGVFKGLPDL
ncbi:MAG: hypothetical protein ACJ763_16105 [Bdellovibrionia bacterium]